MHQARQVPARPPARPVKPAGNRDRVHIPVIAVERQHRRHPHRDSGLSQATRRHGTGQGGHPGGLPSPQRCHIRRERGQRHLIPRQPHGSQVAPPAVQRRRIRADRVRGDLAGDPQVIQELLDGPDRKMILPGHGPRPLPLEHHPLHRHEAMLPTLPTLLWDPRQRHADVRFRWPDPRRPTLRTGLQEPRIALARCPITTPGRLRVTTQPSPASNNRTIGHSG